MRRGEIWWADLPFPRGSEPAKRRPVLVIQNDSMNRSAINTIVCATITTNLSLASASSNILLEKKDSGLERTSVINFSQIVTVDKSFFLQQVSMLSKPIIEKIDDALRIVFDI
jgi:mRNA interferase MazF